MSIELIAFIVQLAFGGIAIFLINNDIVDRDIDRKFYWIWSIGVVAGMILLGVIGILVVIASYYIWSRYIY